MINLSKILNVSADYLLGLVPEPTTDMTLKEVCKFTGLSEKTITMFIELKKLDTERELSRFFENDIGKKFLVSIVEYCDDVKSSAAFRGHLAATDYDPIICEIKEEEMKCPQCNRELKIECTSTLKVDLHGNKKKEIIGSCVHCLADYFWIEIIDKSGNKKIEEFRRHFCGLLYND